MLKTIDSALAGAIDVIADDVQATVKSVREQGLRRTLGDAVEDAAGMVKTGAGAVISNVVGGKKGPEKISNHAGLSSSYADLCAGPGSRSMGGGQGGVIFPYTPSPNAGKPGGGKAAAAPKFAAAGFAPGIGIQRASTAPFQTPGGVQVFAKGAAAPPALPGQGAAQMRPYAGFQAPMPAPPPASSPSAASCPAGAKEPPLPAGVLAARFDELRRRDAANNRCFDCDAANPEWASVSFGIFLCIECGGHHRQMGTHISRIRSCKMDSWTERQLQIFNHSGNRHCGEFFAANGVSNTLRFQRYQTPPAEWYRESWIKNRIFDRPVPPPPQGVVAGPCVDKRAEPKAAAKAAPPADLLDFGGDQPAPAAKAAQADLLGFGDAPAAPAAARQAQPAAEADLLGVAAPAAAPPAAQPSGGGDLLGLGGGGGQAASADIFSLAATAQSARPAAAQLASLDLIGTAPALGAVAEQAPARPFWEATAAAPAAPAALDAAAPAPGGAAANTLAGGAKLVDAPKDEKANDPFAMALSKWGM